VTEPDAQSKSFGDDVTALERRVLRLSLLATSSMALLGIVWGVVSGSSVILFDGMYGALGMGLTWLSMVASRLVAGGPTAKYPFGREALAPLVIAVQGVALFATCTYATVDAVLVIVDGGSDVSASSAVVYGVITAVAALAVWSAIRGPARRSELLAAEATQWLAGTALSVAVIIAFGVAIVLDRADIGWAGAYVDPVLVIVACAVLVPAPVRMLRTTIVELLEGAPDPEVQKPVRAAVHEVGQEFGLDEPYLRMTKVGRKLYVEVDFLVAGGDWSVADEDRIRRSLLTRLTTLPYDLWLNVELSGEQDLID
jgi:predicted Co/Zn/Cd cation transporter (cation efflux family)